MPDSPLDLFKALHDLAIEIQCDPIYLHLGIRDAENYANQSDG